MKILKYTLFILLLASTMFLFMAFLDILKGCTNNSDTSYMLGFPIDKPNIIFVSLLLLSVGLNTYHMLNDKSFN